MQEIISNNGKIIFGDIIAKDILNLPSNKKIEDIPEFFLVDKNQQQRTYKGELKIKTQINNEELEDSTVIYFHVCYPIHAKMTKEQYSFWTEKFPNSSTDERIIFVPNKEEG